MQASNRGIPPMDRKLAVTEALGGGCSPRAHVDHMCIQPLGRALKRFGLAHHAADVEIDVVSHRLRGARVPRDLHDWSDGIAGRRAEPGREYHDLSAAAD